MQPRQPVQPLSALESPDQYPVTIPESQLETKAGRREAFAKVASAVGLAMASADKAALADGGDGKKDGRSGLLVIPPAIAVGWVGFNILGPAKNQLDGMADKNDGKPSKTKRR
jgi:hypothetical protein